ncbi:MAG: hypothetical protein ABEL04_03755 [Salinibacter sp.]|uniref:hypothetical protein n=1 Tax=Salinibacter sp. TaxID=2065818 RepID=UPI0035D52AD4
MSDSTIFQVIYALIAIFGMYLTVIRLLEGAWMLALWPAAIAAFCVYRLLPAIDHLLPITGQKE